MSVTTRKPLKYIQFLLCPNYCPRWDNKKASPPLALSLPCFQYMLCGLVGPGTRNLSICNGLGRLVIQPSFLLYWKTSFRIVKWQKTKSSILQSKTFFGNSTILLGGFGTRGQVGWGWGEKFQTQCVFYKLQELEVIVKTILCHHWFCQFCLNNQSPLMDKTLVKFTLVRSSLCLW